MEALLSLEGYEPDLRDYLLQHRYPTILEVFHHEMLVVLATLM